MSDFGGDGFEEFVDAELPRLVGLGHALTGNSHDAWELAQECLVRVGLRWRHVDRGGNPGAYARTALVRLHLNARRRRRFEVPLVFAADRGGEDKALAEVELTVWLRATLAELPPRQRAAVVLRYVEDMSVAQIAECLDCSLGTAKSQLSRAVERLRATQSSDPRLTADDVMMKEKPHA